MRPIRTLLALSAIAFALNAGAQSLYTSPDGTFTVHVPEGWHAEPDLPNHQVTLRDGAVQAILMVSPQNRSNAMTAQEFLDATAAEFQGQCPTARVVKKGAASLAAFSALSTLFTCSDPKSPAVAETSAALTANNILIALTTIAPLPVYYANLPTLDAIRSSIRLVGQPVPTAPNHKDLAVEEIKKACVVGAFPQEECARRIAIVTAPDVSPGEAQASAPNASRYIDPQSRFTVDLPPGWHATPEGDDGSLGVQLRSGPSFINIMPAPPATSTADVVLQQDNKVAIQSNTKRKPPFSNAGIVQLFGSDLDLSYDNFSASDPHNETTDTFIAGITDLAGKTHTFLLLVASLNTSQTPNAAPIFLSTAQSIHLIHH